MAIALASGESDPLCASRAAALTAVVALHHTQTARWRFHGCFGCATDLASS